MISVLILTYQEERNIGPCLDALDWCNDIVVVDSFSADRTVEIARARGARVLQRAFDDFAGQRNWGLAEGGFRHSWVLHLDADEIVTPELRDEMVARIARADVTGEVDAFRVPSKMMFDGAWLKHAGMYPTYQVRLGRRDRLTFHQVGHGQRETLPPERLGTLNEDLLHYSFSKGLAEWFEKHNRYSTDEAAHAFAAERAGAATVYAGLTDLRDLTLRRRTLKALFSRLPFRPTLRFLYMYIGRCGFLDGAAGWRYCRLLAMYERMTVYKLRELRRLQGAEARTAAGDLPHPRVARGRQA